MIQKLQALQGWTFSKKENLQNQSEQSLHSVHG